MPLAILPVILLLFYFTASQHFSYTPDDTFIYLQVAKNVVNGDGVAFNAGEPTYVVTSPLWMLIVAAGGKLGIDLYIAAKAIDLFIASMSIILFFFLAFEMIRELIVALLATLAFSMNIWFVRWAGTGMETSLSVFLVIAAFLYTMRNEYLLAATFAAFLTLVRPEAVWLIGLIMLDIYINSNDKRRGIRAMMMSISAFAVIILPWLIYAAMTFGSVVPNTVTAKSGFGFDIGDSVTEIGNIIRIVGASDGVAAITLLGSAVLLVAQFRKNGIPFPVDEEKFYVYRQSVIGIGWILLIPFQYGAMHVQAVSRYLLLITPLIIIFAFAFLFRVVLKSKFNRFAYGAVVILAALIITQSQIVYRTVVHPGIETFQVGMETSLVAIGKWLKVNTRPEENVLVWDIGAIGYYSDRKVCDAAGLATPEMIPYVKAGYTIRELVDQNIYRNLCDPDYIIHRSEKPEELADRPGLIALMSKPFFGMGLLRMDTQYYTLYKVNKQPSHHESQSQ